MLNPAWVNTIEKSHFHCPSQKLERIMAPYWMGIMNIGVSSPCSRDCAAASSWLVETPWWCAPTLQRMHVWQGAYCLLEAQTLLHVLAVFRFWKKRQSGPYVFWVLIFYEILPHWANYRFQGKQGFIVPLKELLSCSDHHRSDLSSITELSH